MKVDRPEMHQLIGAQGSALVVALVAAIRKTWPKLPSRFVPLLAIALGLALNLGLAWSLEHDLIEGVFFGIVAGLAAVGLYATATRLTPGGKG